MKISSTPMGKGRSAFGVRWFCAGVFAIASVVNWARAEGILQAIPTEAVCVISIHDIESTNTRLSAMFKGLAPGKESLPLADLETTLGFSPGTVDLSRPIHLIFLHPAELTEFFNSDGLGANDAPFPVVAFTPKPGSGLEVEESKKGRIQPREGIWSNYYSLSKDNCTFVANRRKPLRILTRLSPRFSLEQSLDPVARRLIETSDVCIHFQMAGWRDRFSPSVNMAANLILLGVRAQQTPANQAESEHMFKWFVEGGTDAINQMDTLTLALQLDGPVVRLFHHHSFDRNQWVAAYLKNVSRHGDQPFAVLPDRPFLAVGYYDWKCAYENSLASHMNERLFALPGMRKRFTPEQLKKLAEVNKSCANRLRVGDFLFTNPTGGLMPFEILGSTTTDNAYAMLDDYQSLHEDTGDAWTALMTGGLGGGGTFKKETREGVEFRKMSFDDQKIPDAMINEIKRAYGEKVAFEIAAAGKSHLAYSFAQPPSGIMDIIKCQQGAPSIGQNAGVQRIRQALPADSNIVLITDLGRLIQGAGALANWSGGEDTGDLPMATDKKEAPPPPKADVIEGALLGWSCSVRNNTISCQFAMEGDRLRSLLMSLQKGPKAKPHR